MTKVLIVGAGHVGRGMRTLFPDADYLDPPMGFHAHSDPTGRNRDLAIVCVPTPMKENGECDISTVDKVVSQLETEYILIKSTVPPGTCRALTIKYNKKIVFSPEYMGESTYHTPSWAPHPRYPIEHEFAIFGGHRYWCAEIVDMLMPILGPATRYRTMTWEEAELVKYFENAFFALKVTFSNQMRAVCECMRSDQVSYHTVREGWIDDPRVGVMHTAAFKNKTGYSGKCLPKDISALRHFCDSIGAYAMADLLGSVISTNDVRRGDSEKLRVNDPDSAAWNRGKYKEVENESVQAGENLSQNIKDAQEKLHELGLHEPGNMQYE